MANISFNLNDFNKYIQDREISVNTRELAELSSIFKECDTISETGEKGADGKLTGDEMRVFFSRLGGNLRNLVDKYLIGTNEEYAKEAAASNTQAQDDRRGIQLKPVMCERTPAEQEQFEAMLEDVKNTLVRNKDRLGLTEEEIRYINSATTESVNYGAARYDGRTGNDIVKFNKNNPLPSKGNMIKILLHEVNHAVRKSNHNSQAEEKECESKAIERAYMLYQSGDIEDAAIYQSRADGKIYNLSDFGDEKSLNKFINLWLDECGYRGLSQE